MDADLIWSDEFYQLRDSRASNAPLEIAQHLAVQNPWHVPGCTPDAANRVPQIVFGDSIALVDADMQFDMTSGALTVTASFAGGDTAPPGTYSTGLHVVDGQGKLAAQSDTGLPNERFRRDWRTLALADVPPGDYQVRLVVYNWQTGKRLNGVRAETDERGDIFTVGMLKIG